MTCWAKPTQTLKEWLQVFQTMKPNVKTCCPCILIFGKQHNWKASEETDNRMPKAIEILMFVSKKMSTQWRCELTPYTLTESSSELCHVGLIWRHSVSSQGTHKMTHTVRLLWAFCELATHTVRWLWAIREITRWAHLAVVAVSSLWELQTHRKLTASQQCELILSVHCELIECPQNEPSVR